MSRAKSRQNVEVCGDCGALDATWASVNKGILLCTQCCSIHRSLGRHISQVKSIPKSNWHQNQYAMVCTLNNNGANSIWEHTLLENGAKLLKKKPTSKDPIGIKQEFIKAKHQQCAFAFRDNYEDGMLSVENELGKQLHASVRTPNLETSFRLLALGADPNYFHDEKGTTPLHVAVKSEQKLQVELLLVYGADPTCPDAQGKTPVFYAQQLANKDLSNRLIDSQYEVTDTFSFYLALRKPDHTTGIHYHIPQTGFKSNPSSLAKLQKLPNHVFEELAMDVYDEVDRRQTEAVWLSCADTTDLNDVPFLPVDSTLSTTRNQGRQKLARFSTPELKSLVYDILIETQRRQQLYEKGSIPQLRSFSQMPDEDPLYDSVASDDDYSTVPSPSPEDHHDSPEKPLSETNKDSMVIDNTAKTNVILEKLTKALKTSDSTITNLRDEVAKLRSYVETLKSENDELKSRLSQNNCGGGGMVNGTSNSVNQLMDQFVEVRSPMYNGKVMDEIDSRQGRKVQRPSSMYETREGLTKVANWHALKNEMKQNEMSRNATQSLYGTPQSRETILQCTEQVTRNIQHLCKTIQDVEKEECVSSAERVKFSVLKLAANLTKETDGDLIRFLIETSKHLVPECSDLQTSSKQGDSEASDTHFKNIRSIAYNLAKYTKEIVTKYSSSQ